MCVCVCVCVCVCMRARVYPTVFQNVEVLAYTLRTFCICSRDCHEEIRDPLYDQRTTIDKSQRRERERERERESECMCVCVCERERESVCVPVRKRAKRNKEESKQTDQLITKEPEESQVKLK